MLSDKQKELLTAYVDGEVSARQRRLVARLVRKLPAARQLLHELEKDSRQLTALPRKKPPREIVRQVLRQTAAHGAPIPATPSTLATPAAAGMPSWVSITLAASVLAAITLGSYLFFS